MVVGKVMKWWPWAPAAGARRKKYQVKVEVRRIDGLSLGGEEEDAASVEIRWKGPPKTRGLSYLTRRKKPAKIVTVHRRLRGGAVAEEPEEDDEAGFDHVCRFWVVEKDNSFSAWNVSFHVLLHGKGHEEERKPEEIGTALLNLGELASQVHSKGDNEPSEQLQAQIDLPITMESGNFSSTATISVSVKFVEIRTSQVMGGGVVTEDKKSPQVEEASDGQAIDDSYNFDSDDSDGALKDQPVEAVVAEEPRDQICDDNNNNNKKNLSGEGEIANTKAESPPRRRFLSWRRKRKKSRSSSWDESTSVNNKKKHPSSEADLQEEDLVGRWEDKELISRDGKTKLKAQTFFASIDQRDETAGGESACTALVAVIAEALHSNRVNTPTRSEFDALIREGSSEWQQLCEIDSYTDRFPNKHFDLETILEANIRPISLSPERSYIGFFQPESFESLRGAMSFDDMWREITSGIEEGEAKVYIVSWNDHFFVLKLESDVYYLMDTLGERLFEGCNKAYILSFDGSASMYHLPEKDGDGDGDGEEIICGGKDCCGEFIKKFLAAIPLREELEVEEKKGSSANIALHQRLQIEFHFTVASNTTMAASPRGEAVDVDL